MITSCWKRRSKRRTQSSGLLSRGMFNDEHQVLNRSDILAAKVEKTEPNMVINKLRLHEDVT